MYQVNESNNPFSQATNLFISENDIYCNMDRFLKKSPRQANICFVTGFSGSGKSTIAKKLAKYHKITYVELDYLTFVGRRKPFTEKDCKDSNHEILWKYIKSTNRDPAFIFKIDPHDLVSQIKEEIEFVKWLNKQSGNFVVEGVQCVDIIPANPEWLEYPIIFKGTSWLTSFIRGILRDEIFTRDDLIEAIRTIIKRLKWFYSSKSGFDHLRNRMIHKDNFAEVPDSVWDSVKLENTTIRSDMMLDTVIEGHDPRFKKEDFDPKKMKFAYCNKVANSVYSIGDKDYRVRVEVLILKEIGNEKYVFFEKRTTPCQYGHMYKLPGGSAEPNCGFAEQAARECQEEVRINVKDMRDMDIIYKVDYEVVPEWVKKMLYPIGVHYNGCITKVYCAKYGGKFNGYIKKVDRDDLLYKGDFHPLKDFLEIAMPEHKEALEKYISQMKGDIPEGLPSNVYRDKFGNLKQKGDSHYVGMMEVKDVREWRDKIEYKMFTIRKTPQPCIMFNGGPYRARTDVIIINPKGEVLVDMKKGRGGFHYSFPGGGIDKGQSVEECAIREAREEARVVVKDCHFTGIIWFADYEDPTYNKGQFSFLCIGKYYGPDHSAVKQSDKDEFVDRATWEHWTKIGLKEPHLKAIEKFMQNRSAVHEMTTPMMRSLPKRKLHRKVVHRHAMNNNVKPIVSQENSEFDDWF